jgi:transcriptional regulator with PAS, ATPase and Fis domain
MPEVQSWVEQLPVAVTVTTADGTIIAMNSRSRDTFADDGGGALIGQSVFACHPEPARAKTETLYASRQPNHYTICKNGQRKIIHQLPWFQDGAFAGFVEIAIPIPDNLPHFDRG